VEANSWLMTDQLGHSSLQLMRGQGLVVSSW